MGPINRKIWVVYLVLSLTTFIIVWTGIIPKWGYWYSNHLPLRWQADRMLHGQVAMSTEPYGMAWDLAWCNGKVEQLWGLGIPCWQLPFEAVARVAGQPAFPDRLVFVIALAGSIWFLTWFLLRYHGHVFPQLNPWLSWLGLLPTALFPPFLALCSSRFLVYEEVLAYGFVIGMVLLVWVTWLTISPGIKSYFCLAFVSGLMVFIRPTFGVYGLASLVVAGLVFLRHPLRVRIYMCSVGIFVLGIILLFWTNALRFGAPSEFGHSLATNSDNLMGFCTRFGSPSHGLSMGTASKELFGFLFLTRSKIFANPYMLGLFPGQSDVFRWRELYFSTYDLISFFMVVTVVAWLACRLGSRLRSRTGINNLDVLEVISLWSVLPLAPLVLFYLRFPFLSSRYMLDFGPAFSAATLVFFGLLLRFIARFGSKRLSLSLIVAVFGWWGYEVLTINDREPGHPVRQDIVLRQMAEDVLHPQYEKIPQCYTNGYHFDNIGIKFNGNGWYPNGDTAAYVVIYVENPECLILDLAPAGDSSLKPGDYDCIQAKLGLEFLQRESITSATNGVRIIFRGPGLEENKSGVQQASIALMEPAALRPGNSKFRLFGVGWHK